MARLSQAGVLTKFLLAPATFAALGPEQQDKVLALVVARWAALSADEELLAALKVGWMDGASVTMAWEPV